MSGQKKGKVRKEVQEIAILFELAQQSYVEHPEQAHAYVKKARKLGMSSRVRMTPAQRRMYCHSCYHFLFPGRNAIVRRREGLTEITCKDCGRLNRFG